MMRATSTSSLSCPEAERYASTARSWDGLSTGDRMGFLTCVLFALKLPRAFSLPRLGPPRNSGQSAPQDRSGLIFESGGGVLGSFLDYLGPFLGSFLGISYLSRFALVVAIIIQLLRSFRWPRLHVVVAFGQTGSWTRGLIWSSLVSLGRHLGEGFLAAFLGSLEVSWDPPGAS